MPPQGCSDVTRGGDCHISGISTLVTFKCTIIIIIFFFLNNMFLQVIRICKTPSQMSKPIKGEEAQTFGLVDAIVRSDELIRTARRWALDIAERRKPWIVSLYRSDKLEPLGEAREILKFARAQARKQAPNLHHPLVCIDVIEEGIVSGPRAGLWKVNTISHHFILSWRFFFLSFYNPDSMDGLGRRWNAFSSFFSLTPARP